MKKHSQIEKKPCLAGISQGKEENVQNRKALCLTFIDLKLYDGCIEQQLKGGTIYEFNSYSY
ncbi:hypothetical protein AWH49_11635 [Domibacillus aminovorans]|uniref:Uncharacterized protein n=1 Tax=Domibacillus aminovorans TaxID=29332 RepID=A0A177L8Q0_9BACI|nr:hypothetical protein AWH48_08855 [Domibacillus aminovorans]OAH61595.1 hypothetical protein AWH49_11635 [Domibacillus aminovorans]